jgi:hypothetical protein
VKGKIMAESSVASSNATETQDTDLYLMVCWKFWTEECLLIDTHCWEAMKSLGCHGHLITAIHDEGDGLTLCEHS